MARTWGDSWGDAWGDSWGIGIAAESTGIGLAAVARPVDYVFADGWHPAIPRFQKLTRFEEKKAVKSDNSDLIEMMEIYSRWKKAA